MRETSECLERPHSLIRRFLEVATQQRAVDVALESFYQRVCDGPGYELDVEIEACRGQKSCQSFDRRAGQTSLDPGDDGLSRSRSAGELALREGSPLSCVPNQVPPVGDSIHAIMIAF